MALEAAGPAPKNAEERSALSAADRFLGSWRADFDLQRAVRSNAPQSEDRELKVGRRVLEVGYEAPPQASVRWARPGTPSPFVTDTSAVQSYIIPVLSAEP
jgi:hypothetical protein